VPRHWVVERTLAWITRCRRTVRDYDRLPGHHEAIMYWEMTFPMTRRLAPGQRLSRPPPRARQALRWSRPALNGGLLSLLGARVRVQARDGALNDHFQELGVDLFP
jgi:hypothetical protein